MCVCVCLLSCVLPQDAWNLAEKVSFASGNPFNDRNGKRQNVFAEKIGIIEIVMHMWISRFQ